MNYPPASSPRRLIALVMACLVCTAMADDWPTFRHDLRRSGTTTETLQTPLQKSWVYRPAQAPAPAWGRQPKLLNRIDFDYSPQLVVAGGMVVFGSSADDTVRALKLADGTEAWHYTTGGPIRFAPQIADGRVYVAADDGVATCLDLATGALVWKFTAAPWSDRMVGNGRMISRWPARCGMLVVDGVAYVTAGFWPSDGIYLYALDAKTGAVVWVRDELGYLGNGFVDMVDGNHQGEFGTRGASPQGAMVYDDGVLILPQGHSNPIRLIAATGESAERNTLGEERGDEWAAKMREDREKKGLPVPEQRVLDQAARMLGNRGSGRPGSGGTWVTVDKQTLYVLAMHRGRKTYLNAWNIHTGDYTALNHSDKVLPQIAGDGLNRTVAPGRVSVVVKDGSIVARNAYDLIMAGEQVVLGHEHAVSIIDPTDDREIWRANVDGEARSLAIVDGQLLVSTRTGEITCFVPDGATLSRPTTVDTTPTPTAAPALSAAHQAALQRLVDAEIDQGFCLLIGAASEPLARALAAQTRLQVIVSLRDEAQVAALRERLVTGTSLYGTRIHVQHQPEADRLPFAQYFANALILTGGPEALPATELYRVLRPCGGLLQAPDLAAPAAQALLTASTPIETEFLTDPPRVLRGQITGANDIDNPVADPHVRWPLQALWYGGPAPMDLPDDASGEEFASPPTAAFGLCYTRGAEKLICYDAYNGTVRWTRPVPKMWAQLRDYDGDLRNVVDVAPVQYEPMHWRKRLGSSIAANPDHAFLVLLPGYFDQQGNGVLQLDSRTGEQVGVSAPYIPGPSVSLTAPQHWQFRFPAPTSDGKPALDIDAARTLAERWKELTVKDVDEARKTMTEEGGLLSMAADAEGLTITLESRDPLVTNLDIWELFFDFRPQSERYGLYNRGTFAVQVVPALSEEVGPSWAATVGEAHPDLTVTGERSETGTLTTVRLEWAAIEAITGSRPTDFGFAATMNAHDGNPSATVPIRQRHLFADHYAHGMNVGWANIYLGDVPAEVPVPGVINQTPAKERGPEWAMRYTFYAREIDPSIADEQRVHPLTLELGPKLYRTGTWACGGPSMSASAIFRRASKPMLGVYDFAEDSGLHFIAGIEASCGTSSVAALGLLNYREARFRCDCNPPIRTSFALAPAERKYNEDWSIFYENPMRSQVRVALLNLGAFGDRRETPERLWLNLPRDLDRGFGYPFPPGKSRPLGMPIKTEGFYLQQVPAGMQLPAEVTWNEAFGPYRRNSDRIDVTGTEQQWIYGSGVLGIERLRVILDAMHPMQATRADGVVTIDGKLDESTWQGEPTLTLANTTSRIYLRHDEATLYVGVTRAPMVSKLGTPLPWQAETTGEDAEVWKDDAVELFLAARDGSASVHIGLSASGARYDARGTGEPTEDTSWNAAWTGAAVADEAGLTWELAIPLAALAAAGIPADQLALNLMIDQSDTRADVTRFVGAEGRNWNVKSPTSESLFSLGSNGRTACTNFGPLGLSVLPEFPRRRFSVKLHFAELDGNVAGRRVFDVLANGKVQLAGVDIAAEVGTRAALVKTLEHLELGEDLILEFRAKAGEASAETVPILSGLEILEERMK